MPGAHSDMCPKPVLGCVEIDAGARQRACANAHAAVASLHAISTAHEDKPNEMTCVIIVVTCCSIHRHALTGRSCCSEFGLYIQHICITRSCQSWHFSRTQGPAINYGTRPLNVDQQCETPIYSYCTHAHTMSALPPIHNKTNLLPVPGARTGAHTRLNRIITRARRPEDACPIPERPSPS